jgi:hypothetical protein
VGRVIATDRSLIGSHRGLEMRFCTMLHNQPLSALP